ncbi:MAG: hypothetical protein JHD07_04065 [Bradyrhizobium sp.]|uniref:hypothetical protein n=1 Tax=Bradyrhizobium sp. TaxID=376 RepID=UPI001A33F2B1|nr:hypothetical protein [Bradyrhizobium sp.]MBJ7402497.1 hypothetical protein [Bradyrhizobium sp.]
MLKFLSVLFISFSISSASAQVQRMNPGETDAQGRRMMNDGEKVGGGTKMTPGQPGPHGTKLLGPGESHGSVKMMPKKQ